MKETVVAAVGALLGAALVGFFAGEASYLLGSTKGLTFVIIGVGVLIGGFSGLGLAIWAYEAPWRQPARSSGTDSPQSLSPEQ